VPRTRIEGRDARGGGGRPGRGGRGARPGVSSRRWRNLVPRQQAQEGEERGREERGRDGAPAPEAGEGRPPDAENPGRERERGDGRPRRADDEQAGRSERAARARSPAMREAPARHSMPGRRPWVSARMPVAMPGTDGLRAIVFDWDGTLVDSAERTYACYVRVFAAFGSATTMPPSSAPTRPTGIGLTRRSACPASTGRMRTRAGSPATKPGRAASSRRAGGSGAAGRARAGPRLVSSGDGKRVRREVRALGLSGLFGAVVCGGETARRKPDPEPLLVPWGGSACRRPRPPTSATARRTWPWRGPPARSRWASRAVSRTARPRRLAARRPRPSLHEAVTSLLG